MIEGAFPLEPIYEGGSAPLRPLAAITPFPYLPFGQIPGVGWSAGADFASLNPRTVCYVIRRHRPANLLLPGTKLASGVPGKRNTEVPGTKLASSVPGSPTAREWQGMTLVSLENQEYFLYLPCPSGRNIPKAFSLIPTCSNRQFNGDRSKV